MTDYVRVVIDRELDAKWRRYFDVDDVLQETAVALLGVSEPSVQLRRTVAKRRMLNMIRAERARRVREVATSAAYSETPDIEAMFREELSLLGEWDGTHAGRGRIRRKMKKLAS